MVGEMRTARTSLLSSLESKAVGVMKPESRAENPKCFLFSSQQVTSKVFDSTEISISQTFWSNAEMRGLYFSCFSNKQFKHKNTKLRKHGKHDFLIQVLWSYVVALLWTHSNSYTLCWDHTAILVLGSPDPHTALQVRLHKGRVEGRDHLP